jgi:hypothetical protein
MGKVGSKGDVTPKSRAMSGAAIVGRVEAKGVRVP